MSEPVVIEIPNWVPTNLNKLLRMHWSKRSDRLRADAEMVAMYALKCHAAHAVGRRKVEVECSFPHHLPDPDNLTKSLLDALVKCGMLVDDSPYWCSCVVNVTQGPRRTMITLTDLPGRDFVR